WAGLRLRADTGASRGSMFALLLVAASATAAGFAALLFGHQAAGLAPRTDAWSATLAAMLAYQALHVIIILIMTGYLAALWWRPTSTLPSRVSFHNVAVFFHYTSLQGAVIALAPIAIVAAMS